jgi:hypothetical protein
MHCPRCFQLVNHTADQIAAIGAMAVPTLVLGAPYIATMIAAPYLAPFLLVGLIWSATRKVSCPSCGHRFTFFQEGKQ